MATVNGTNYAIAVAPTRNTVMSAGLWGGKVRAQMDIYTFTSDSAGEVVRVAIIPAKARFVMAYINHADLGGSPTLAMGDSGSSGRFIAAASAAAAGRMDNAALNVGYEFTAETIILVTTAGDSSDGIIHTCFMYSME